jgi:hypothetical protein
MACRMYQHRHLTYYTCCQTQVVLAKTLLSGWVQRSVLPKLPNGRVLERMIKNQGFIGIAIFRGFVYAPLPVKNYGLGALDIPASQIVAAAVITGAPYAYWWAYVKTHFTCSSTASEWVGVGGGSSLLLWGRACVRARRPDPTQAASLALWKRLLKNISFVARS